MASLFFLRSALRPHWLITVLLLGLTACESEPRPPRHENPSDAGVAAKPAMPELQTHGVFFAGQVEVETVLNSSGFMPRGGGRDSGSRGSGGGDGGGRSGGGGRGGGGRRGGRGGPSGESGQGGGRGDSDGPTPNIHASNEPPVSFHLRLTNHGDSPVSIEVLDFNSELGNFVVQPEKITVPPGESVEAQPMVSRLGVTSAEIPLTLRLRANGKTEMQILTLRGVTPPPGEQPPSVLPPQPAPSTS